MPEFFDNDGQPVSIGDAVRIGFNVVSVQRIKNDKFPTVTLKLKHNPQGMKFKIDSGQQLHTAPTCIIDKE